MRTLAPSHGNRLLLQRRRVGAPCEDCALPPRLPERGERAWLSPSCQLDQGPVDPPNIKDAEEPKVFLFLSSVIQLMENIYLDLELEATADHPHCAGWIQIFQAWAEAPLFRRAWQRYSWSYGRNFRRFCRRRFGLPSLDVG